MVLDPEFKLLFTLVTSLLFSTGVLRGVLNGKAEAFSRGWSLLNQVTRPSLHHAFSCGSRSYPYQS